MHRDGFLFVQAIRKKNWLGMIASIDAALVAASRPPAPNDRPDAPASGSSPEFVQFLIATREYLLAEGRMRPKGLGDEAFALLMHLCESLVAQGRFSSKRLELFGGLTRWSTGAWPRFQGGPAAPDRKDGG